VTQTTQADIEEHLPLTPRVFHLLLALMDGPQHGYALMKEVEDRSGGKVRVGPGTLYEAVHTLRDRGLVAETEARPDDHDARRRYYELTPFGRRVLAAETERLADLVDFARRRQAPQGRG